MQSSTYEKWKGCYIIEMFMGAVIVKQVFGPNKKKPRKTYAGDIKNKWWPLNREWWKEHQKEKPQI